MEQTRTGPKAFEPVPVDLQGKTRIACDEGTEGTSDKASCAASADAGLRRFHADEKRGKPSDRPDSCGIWKLAKVREVLYNVWKRSHGRWCFNAICQTL